MFRNYLLGAAVLSLLFAGGLLAAHHTYVNSMKAVAKVTGPTAKAVAAGDLDTAKKNANVLARNFTVMAAWWEGRGSSSAFKLADGAAKAAVNLRKAANSGDKDAAMAAMGEIRGSCKACHSTHRVKNEDGSWGFKD